MKKKIDAEALLKEINMVCFSSEPEWIYFRIENGSHGQRDYIINYIERQMMIPTLSDCIHNYGFFRGIYRWITRRY